MSHQQAIAGALTGGALGGVLAAALADSPLEGAVIGGVLGASLGRFLANEQQKVVFPTGKEVDLYLNSSPLIQKHIQHKIDRGRKVEGHLHFLPNEEFEALCFDYLLANFSRGATLPQGKTPIKASDIVDKAREIAKRSHGFQSRSEIYINQKTAEAGTVIHESIHLFQEHSYAKRVGPNANEGTTEYFTRLICDEHQIIRRQKYLIQYECIKKLVAICGEDKLAGAYFQGHLLALENTVDASKKPGTFQIWTDFMKNEEFKNANQLLS